MVEGSSSTTNMAHSTGRWPNMNDTGSAPPGYGLRRSVTVDETAALRRRPSLNPINSQTPFGEGGRRQSSTFSDYSLNTLETDTDELLNLGKEKTAPHETNPYATVPLVLALLPAVGGLLFEGGSAFFTDLILLGLAALFLHWSVTQPWNWYHATQEIRVVKDAAMSTPVFDSDSDFENSQTESITTALEDVPEEDESDREDEIKKQTTGASRTPLDAPRKSSAQKKWESRRDAAAKELYIHEILALSWCFIFPMLSAYLLHAIRGQLSRPSEGLVSDYNLSIFLIAAEVRPVSHLIKLLQSRTVRKQRIVTYNPYEQQSVRDQQIQELRARLEELEARQPTDHDPTAESTQQSTMKTVENLVARKLQDNLQDNVQPELDTLNRAMRRYEKRLSVLIEQVDVRLEYLDDRLNDAITLAAVAAKHGNSQGNLFTWFLERSTAIIMLPIQTLVAICTFPYRTVSSLIGRKRVTDEKPHKKGRRTPSSGRVPTRMSKK
ncbi:hypothetical protein BX600DRAFT_456145 [Xylariales sp. PMI_506]|nr:hypothetical protein BX600DRAFT_456145 [Xylariales sp. PMI_506]